MATRKRRRPDPDKWETETLRLTAFPTAGFVAGRQAWWQETVGLAPDREMSLPKESQWQAEGTVNEPDMPEATLGLKLGRSRIEWRLNAKRQEELIELERLGSFTAILPIFQRLMAAWLSAGSVQITRLALGAVLDIPVEDRERGYHLLSQYLPFELDPTTSSDFVYRINRPLPSAVLDDGTLINRLQTWAVIEVELMSLSVSVGQARTPELELSSKAPPFSACRLELDINTAKERIDPLPQDKLTDLLDEFAQASLAIAAHGDKP